MYYIHLYTNAIINSNDQCLACFYESSAGKLRGRALESGNAAGLSVPHAAGCGDTVEDSIPAKTVSLRSRMLIKPGLWVSFLKEFVHFLLKKKKIP